MRADDGVATIRNQVEIMLMKRRGLLVCVLVFWLTTLTLQSIAFAEGRFEHHQIASRILADAGQPADREVSIYIPENMILRNWLTLCCT